MAARRIARDHQREWGEAPPLATRLDELTLLRYDKQRVWFEDLERWAGEEAFVVALTAKERAALERRDWTFATPEEVRLAFGYGQLYEDGRRAPADMRRSSACRRI